MLETKIPSDEIFPFRVDRESKLKEICGYLGGNQEPRPVTALNLFPGRRGADDDSSFLTSWFSTRPSRWVANFCQKVVDNILPFKKKETRLAA